MKPFSCFSFFKRSSDSDYTCVPSAWLSEKYTSRTICTISSLIMPSTFSLDSCRVTSYNWYSWQTLRTMTILRKRAAPTQKSTERKVVATLGS